MRSLKYALICLLISSCGPTQVLRQDFIATPPPGGNQACVSACQAAQQACPKNCGAFQKGCQNVRDEYEEEDTIARQSYNSYAQGERSHDRTPKLNYNDFKPVRLSTRPECTEGDCFDNCADQYTTCYEQCGGRIRKITPRTCTANCAPPGQIMTIGHDYGEPGVTLIKP